MRYNIYLKNFKKYAIFVKKTKTFEYELFVKPITTVSTALISMVPLIIL